MNLLYIWSKLYSEATETDGYQLSSRYDITFHETSRRLSIRRKESLSSYGFWGEHIYDVMAVVGRNGAGKTRLAYSIMDTLDEAIRVSGVNNFRNSQFSFLLVFEDSKKKLELEIIAANIPNLEIDSNLSNHIYHLPNVPSRSPDIQCDLRCFKFAYFTDALSLADYKEKKYGIVHNGSLGGGICQAFESNRQRHYIARTTSPITNYFDDEMDCILKFVCFERDEDGIPFPLPKWITFSPKDHRGHLNYISVEQKTPKGGAILDQKCDEMLQQYERSVRGRLAIHVMLNLFKTYCISRTVPEHLEETVHVFLEKISQMKCLDSDPFVPVLNLMEEIEPAITNPKFLVRCRDMLQWIQAQPALRESKGQDVWMLDLEKDAEIVQGLYNHYRKTKFPFPYFSISFGLSTGEYAFLRRFVRINELLSKNSNGYAYVTNNLSFETQCDGLMLYFDEADQSLHPEWQREQIDWLLQFISARFKTCKVQLVVSTHSPIILSDIPRDHVLYLSNSGQKIQAEKREVRTFGCNIHTLFRDAFFLSNGTMGAFAERKINEIAQSLQESEEEVPPDILSIVEEIGDDVIRNKLRQMCRIRPSSRGRQMDRQTAEQTIHLLRNQVKHLEAVIRELENMRYD